MIAIILSIIVYRSNLKELGKKQCGSYFDYFMSWSWVMVFEIGMILLFILEGQQWTYLKEQVIKWRQLLTGTVLKYVKDAKATHKEYINKQEKN